MDTDVAIGLAVLGVAGAMILGTVAGLTRLICRMRQPKSWLDTPLFWLTDRDPFTIRDLLAAGVAIFGRAGSGKTSGSGRTLAKAIVAHPRSAGLILAAKPEELADWQNIFAQARRNPDLLVVSPNHDLKCDFLGWTLANGGSTREVVSCITTIGETLRSSDRKGGDDADFFQAQNERMLYHAVCVVKLGTGRVSAPDLQRFIDSAPLSCDALRTPEFRAGFCSRTIEAAAAAKKSPEDAADFEQAAAFWLGEFVGMADRTRSGILAGVLGLLFVFNNGVVRRLVSNGTNVSPADILAGKWIIVDMSPTTWGESGVLVESGFKYLTQKAVLRRKAGPNDPFVVIWVDEAQTLLNSFDAHYAAQSRSHLGCIVVLTQSLHGVFAALKGETGKQQALGFLATMGHRVFHALGSAEDARYASDSIGRRVTIRYGGSVAPASDMHDLLFGQGGVTTSFQETVEPILEPRAFMTGLRTGGHGGLVDAIIVRSGEPFASGESFVFSTFKQ